MGPKAGRDYQNCKLLRKHGESLISTLRETHGRSFALGMPGGEKLIDVIHQLDQRSLAKLLRAERRDPVTVNFNS
jgi:hypothetical protein